MAVTGGEVLRDLSGKSYEEKVKIRKDYLKRHPGEDVQVKGDKLIKY